MDLNINFKKNLIDEYNQAQQEIAAKNHKEDNKQLLQKRFLLSAKNLYLRYSACVLELTTVIELLKVRLSSYIVQYYVLVREINETTGKPEIHVYLKLAKKTNIVSESFLDLTTDENVNHGTYQTAKNPNAIIRHILKHVSTKYDKNLLFSPTLDPLIDKLGEFKNFYELEEFKNFYASLLGLVELEKFEEAMSLLERLNPEFYRKVETNFIRAFLGKDKKFTGLFVETDMLLF